jgi:hypothetical protein
MILNIVKAFLLALVLVPHARAQSATDCSAPEFRKFDFWIGDWDTFDMDAKDTRTSIARNHVDLILGRCVLREDYDQFDGHHGQSFTVFDATRNVWHQSWVTNRGELLVLEGTRVGNRITLQGDSVTAQGKQRTRVFWEPQGDEVRETATTSKDEGKSWQPLFDIVFKRHPH